MVHISQHATSRPTTRSTQNTLVNAPKKNFSQHPAGKYGISTHRATPRRHQANEGKSGLEVKQVRVLGALRSLLSKKKLAAEKRQETHFLSNEEKEKCIEVFVERETPVARKRVQDAETAMMLELKDMTTAPGKPGTTFQEMLNAVGHSLSNLASSDDEHDGEDEEDDDVDTQLGKLSDDDEPGCVMDPISKTVQDGMESFRRKQMRLVVLTQPEWGDVPN